MAIEKITRPYEFLVRWRNGAISGAHVSLIEEVVEDGQVLSHKVLDVMPVAIGEAQGFPLAEVLNEVQAGAVYGMEAALAERDAKAAELKTAEEALKAANDELAAVRAEVESVRAQLAEAQAEIEKLTAPAPQIIIAQ